VLDPKWAYRRAAVESVLAAVRTMLVGRAESGAKAAPPPRKKYRAIPGASARRLISS
jgi:hypothetical protein